MSSLGFGHSTTQTGGSLLRGFIALQAGEGEEDSTGYQFHGSTSHRASAWPESAQGALASPPTGMSPKGCAPARHAETGWNRSWLSSSLCPEEMG